VQWDSFRFWESLAAGCLVFNLDLERYGAELPVMPENWEHYIGINLERIDEAIDRVRSEPESLARIAEAGRLWALEYYSPRAMAGRFLELVGLPGVGAAKG
jgi:hypothetical protein